MVSKFVRQLFNLDANKFISDLKEEPITRLNYIYSLTIDESIMEYDCVLKRLLDKHCPLILKRYRLSRAQSKWYNPHLQGLKQKKRQMERKFKKNPNKKNQENLKTTHS